MAHADIKTLTEISTTQWGLITTAQAEEAGVSRLKLSRLVERGLLVRLAHGVYRDAGAAESNYEPVKVAWLSTNPTLLTEERLRNPDIIVGGTTATVLWDCGDLEPYPYQFYTKGRKQTQRKELKLLKTDFTDNDYQLVDGLPVARIEFVIADLLKRNYDNSLVFDVFKDARKWLKQSSQAGVRIDLDYLQGNLDRIAKRNRFRSGAEFLEYLHQSIGESQSDYMKTIYEMTQSITESFASMYINEAKTIAEKIAQSHQSMFSELTEQISSELSELAVQICSNAAQAALDTAGIAKYFQSNIDKEMLDLVVKTVSGNWRFKEAEAVIMKTLTIGSDDESITKV
jgi:hypothetical protein